MLEIPLMTCKIVMHENGFEIFSDKFGSRVILFKEMKNLQFLV
jgi:hypothetical protein